MSKIRIKDVAARANVSTATVSNVINKRGRVSPETIKRVEQVIKELEFIPSASARLLKQSRSGLIGVIVPYTDHKSQIKDNPHYWGFIASLQEMCDGKDIDFILRGINCNAIDLSFIREKGLDGIIVFGAPEGSDIVSQIKELMLPTVFVDCYLDDNALYQVIIDDCQGMYLATKHLMDLGHTRIALMSEDGNTRGVSYQRWLGYKLALGELYDESIFFIVNTSIQDGMKTGEKILKSHPDVTGVVTSSDNGAVGLVTYLQNNGASVPDDFSVVGFDNSFLSTLCIPNLTTIHQDIDQKAALAYELLEQQMERRVGARTRGLSVELVVRDSTGKVREKSAQM